jgi:hypothetical protein
VAENAKEGGNMNFLQKQFIPNYAAPGSGLSNRSVMHESIAIKAGLSLNEREKISAALRLLNFVVVENPVWTNCTLSKKELDAVRAEFNKLRDMLREIISQSPYASKFNVETSEATSYAILNIFGPGVSFGLKREFGSPGNGFDIWDNYASRNGAAFSGAASLHVDHERVAKTLHKLCDYALLYGPDAVQDALLMVRISELTGSTYEELRAVPYRPNKQQKIQCTGLSTSYLFQMESILTEVAALRPERRFDIWRVKKKGTEGSGGIVIKIIPDLQKGELSGETSQASAGERQETLVSAMINNEELAHAIFGSSEIPSNLNMRAGLMAYLESEGAIECRGGEFLVKRGVSDQGLIGWVNKYDPEKSAIGGITIKISLDLKNNAFSATLYDGSIGVDMGKRMELLGPAQYMLNPPS